LQGLGIQHVRYLKGYANVIGKARELTESGKASAEVAIETSGHCAMRENGYLDDGTYTAVKVIGLLARVTRSTRISAPTSPPLSLLDLIADLEEMPQVSELRMDIKDGSTVTTNNIFSKLVDSIQDECDKRIEWELDADNLEGVRVRIGNGGFFMLRKSLHDPILSLQVEGSSVDSIREQVIQPILTMMEKGGYVASLDVDCLRDY
jgi:Phosphomannomutase